MFAAFIRLLMFPGAFLSTLRSISAGILELGLISTKPEVRGSRRESTIRRRSSRTTARLACRGRPSLMGLLTLSADEGGRQKVESNIRDNPAMNRFEMPLGDGALAVAYYKVEDGRTVLFHTEVPQVPMKAIVVTDQAAGTAGMKLAEAVSGPCLGRSGDGHQCSSGPDHASGPRPDVAADDIERRRSTPTYLAMLRSFAPVWRP